MKMFVYGLALVLAAPSAQAFNQEIRALFTPDPAQPQKNVFINKTPNSGYCGDYPDECTQQNTFSIRLPVNFQPRGPILPSARVSVRVPSQWRQLTVMNRETGETEIVEVRISGIGSEYILSDTATNLTGETDARLGHQALWGGQTWVYAPEPCLYSGVGFYSSSAYRFFWKTPTPGECTKVAAFTIPFMSFTTLDFAYELRTPNPLGMSSGLYTGSINYQIGPAGDFSIGDMQPDDGDLTLDFVLDVQHTLKVDLPPGGNKIELVPDGGWQSWINEGRKPKRLFRDQTFHISASSRFKMMLACDVPYLFDCAIRDPKSGRYAAVELSVTLPNGLTDTAGMPFQRRPMKLGNHNNLFVNPSIYVDRGKGTLHFEVSEYFTDYMLMPGVEAHYAGTMTVIWDSEV